MTEKETDYRIIRPVFGGKNYISITNDNLEKLLNSKQALINITAIEEKFFSICENYRELEEFIYKTTLDHIIHSTLDVPKYHLARLQFGRLLSSFLSCVKLYNDSLCKNVSTISNKSISDKNIKSLNSAEYDGSYHYRVMEAIRSYSQHSELPVHGFTISGKWEGKNGEEKLCFRYDFYLNIKTVNKDKNFKAKTRNEIEENGGKVDLKICVRSYFSSICKIHSAIRKMIQAHKEDATNNFNYWRSMWIEKFPEEKLIGLVAAKFIAEKNSEEDFVNLDPEIDEHREQLERLTKNIDHINKSYVII